MATQNNTSKRIAQLNDAFRKTGLGGRILFTQGIQAFSAQEQSEIWQIVQTFDAFTKDNDPHKEHDFGSFEYQGQKLFWKIDYYDQNMLYGSENPADSNQTTRVLTIMLAEEY